MTPTTNLWTIPPLNISKAHGLGHYSKFFVKIKIYKLVPDSEEIYVIVTKLGCTEVL